MKETRIERSSVSLAVEVTTPHNEQERGQPSGEVNASLRTLAALAMTTALVELRVLAAGLVLVTVTVSGIELGVVATLLGSATSACVTVDVEVEVKVT